MEVSMKARGLDDEDTFSNISRISCGLHTSINSTCNSDSECSGPMSVRDMIELYNNQLKLNESNQINHKNTYKVNTAKKYHHPMHHVLTATKSSYCGLNKFSLMNCKQFADQAEDDNRSHMTDTCCKSCSACMCCRNRSRKSSVTTKMLSSTASSCMLLQPNENNQKPNSNYNITDRNASCCIRSSSINVNKINAKDDHILAVENCSNMCNDAGVATTAAANNPTVLNDFCAEQTDSSNDGLFKNHNSQIALENTKNRLQLIDSVEEANICQQPPVETSYQSKTTIAKTASGVRIIIDILFEPEQCANASDIIGSRVETDIPESRILTEFQKQTMIANVGSASNSYQGH